MKIGILTFHCAHNYGAVLQTYATQQKLKSLGHDVEIINYRPKYITKLYTPISLKRYLSLNPLTTATKTISEFKCLRRRLKQHRNFKQFINKKLNVLTEVKDVSSTNYDVYLIGSDQVWKYRKAIGFDPIYLGFFKTKPSAKLISYAASMEATTLTDQQEQDYKKALTNFNAVSVREDVLATLLQPLTDHTIKTVLDPTLLLKKDDWYKIAQKPNIDSEYVLLYNVRKAPGTIKIAEKIAKQLNVKMIEVTTNIHNKKDSNTIDTASPEEFLGLISNAKAVVTTSFHGTAFSIIFRKDFYTIRLNDGHDSRSESLLNKFGLSSRFIDKGEAPVFSKINYADFEKEANTIINDSSSFLIQSISN